MTRFLAYSVAAMLLMYPCVVWLAYYHAPKFAPLVRGY